MTAKAAQWFSLCLAFWWALPSYAQPIPQAVAVKIIMGEAANQGLKGMICVGEVLRRRASTRGFYGYNADRTAEPKVLWAQALTAWKMSAHTNYTRGADHFENVRRFGPPWWAKYCIKTYTYKDHVFFKEIR